MLSNLAGGGQLAESFFTVSDRKGINRFASHFLRQRRYHARIQASAQKNAQGYIAHEMAADGIFQTALASYVFFSPQNATTPAKAAAV